MVITKKTAQKRIEALRSEILRHNHNYYVLNMPEISDFEYDVLLMELQALENKFPELITPDSPTQVVGSDLSNGEVPQEFEQAPHQYPMLSLSNTYDLQELTAFDERIRKTGASDFTYACELKFDGTAICLTYENGRLLRAITRGDGTIGDVVTQNVRTIPQIPSTLPSISGFDSKMRFEIRGEIYMPFSSFEALNAEREPENRFANPRNAASGSLKLLNPEEVRKRGLHCVLYQLLGENLPFDSHQAAMQTAKQLGFPISEYSKICHNLEEVMAFIRQWDEQRHQLPFPIDGIVIKVNELSIRELVGATAKAPRWATAFKFKAEEAHTRILSIDYQVGRTGAITPVANLEPVQLSGTMVKRASLHNLEQMRLLDVHLNDWVVVEKGGEIIPKITRVDVSKRDPNNCQLPQWPECCPDCGTPLVIEDDEARHYCPNQEGCPTQTKAWLLHFVSRKAMDIHAGEATIEQLYNQGYVQSLPDFYRITREQLLTLPAWKERSAERFLQSVEASKQVPFARVLFALGIRHIGETTAKNLVEHFKTMDQLQAADRETLLAVQDIGEVVADSMLDYFRTPRHQQMIKSLQQLGLQFQSTEAGWVQHSLALAGKTIVISGTFSRSRDEIKKLIQLHSGKNTGSVSGKTSFLLAGNEPGPDKVRKAESLGIPILDEDAFNALINSNNNTENQ
ncbi:MAG: NAD-dependent DNA ligase LigA [Bacteroidales bacterium]|nr:NAD-dependent DNA ligase LigA [Bacteroidales bacterium]